MTHRITLEIPARSYDSMEAVRHLLGVRTKTEVIKRSLALMHVVVEAEANGGKLLVETSKGKTERLRIL